MRLNSKSILGLKSVKDYSISERKMIIEDYLSSGKTKREIWEKYTGQKEEHGSLLRWMRQLGYEPSNSVSSSRFVSVLETERVMGRSFETIQLEKRIAELEKELKDCKMRSIAYSTMVDIAEKEFNISIRKKYNTKP